MTPANPSHPRDKKKELYHCDRCGELFKAPIMPAERVICNVCGNPPVRAIHSNVDAGDLAATPEELRRQEEHRDRKRDVADFVGIQQQRRGKQLKMAFGIWMGLLVVGGIVAIAYKNKVEERAAKLAKKEDSKDYDKIMQFQRTQEAVKRTRPVIRNFVLSPDNNTRSEFVMGGVDMLVPMKQYYDTHPALAVEGQLSLTSVNLVEDGEYPRLDTLMEDNIGKRIEAVFWKEEDKWKLDWAQMVRYSDTSWNTFLLAEQVGSVGQFRLYVRGSALGTRNEDEPLGLIFYEPKIFDGGRGIESPLITVNPHTDLGVAFLKALEGVQEMKPKDVVLGQFDPPGWARVNVKLAWEEVAGKPQLKVKQLYAPHWLTVQGEGVKAVD